MNDILLWSIDEAARQLGGISTRTVRRLIARGELPTVRIGRRALIPADAVGAWVNHTQTIQTQAQETEKWRSTSEAPRGGFDSPRRMDEKYGKLLQLPTDARRRNSTTRAKPSAGGKRS